VTALRRCIANCLVMQVSSAWNFSARASIGNSHFCNATAGCFCVDVDVALSTLSPSAQCGQGQETLVA